MRWNFIRSLEPPKLVHARHMEVLDKANMFGQVTVRFHTQQTLAVYDRFGRLIHGSETVAKDVIEYVVFEKHIANIYGLWRLHSKIIPDWLPAKEPGKLTFRIKSDKETTEAPAGSGAEEKANDKEEADEADEDQMRDRYGRKI